MKISVIIPTLNEEATLRKNLVRLKRGSGVELIVVDGGSRDDTLRIARDFTRKVYSSLPGRARQMNEGARHAEGEILFFLHADSRLSPGALGKIAPLFSNPAIAAGAFSLDIDSGKWPLRLIALLANWRTRISGIPYGDQGLFLLKETFEKIGGYPDIPIMEDVQIARQIRKIGKIRILSEKLATSPRRWEKEGIFFTTLRNRLLMIGHFLGISPQRLAGYYKNIRTC